MEERIKLPQDTIEEILSRLPIKPLARFKCVSKFWYNLISSSNFVKKHLAQTLSNPSHNPFRILIYWPYVSLDYESPSALGGAEDDDAQENLEDPLGPEDPYTNRLVIGSCDGLIALLYDFDRIILWNPSIKVARELPPSPSPYSNVTSFYGFGYDNSTNDYKVIKVVRSNSTNETIAYVFCVNGNSWRTIEGPDKSITIHKEESYYLHGGVGIFLCGALHWLADRGVGAGKLGVILQFDLTTERFSELTQPVIGLPSRTIEFLCVLNDCLALLSIGIEPSELEVGIWVMNEYDICSSWSKQFSINDKLEDGHEYLAPICFARNGDLIINIDELEMMRYNIQEKTFQFLKTCPDIYQSSLYLQSMVSPYLNNDEI